MALTTLANLIQTVEPGADSTAQTALKHFLRRANSLIRRATRRFHGGVIDSNSVAAATVVTSYGHGLTTGDSITISGSGSTPTIDGVRTVTVLTPDTFTVPVTVTVDGSTGYYAKSFTDFYDGNNDTEFQLRNIPVLSITNLWLDPEGYYGQADGAFAAATLLTLGTDYVLRLQESGYSPTGLVFKLSGVWPGTSQNAGMRSQQLPGNGNIKAEYVSGYKGGMPPDLSLAAEMIVAKLYRIASDGAEMAGESIDYYSYTRMSADEEAKALASVVNLLKSYTTALT